MILLQSSNQQTNSRWSVFLNLHHIQKVSFKKDKPCQSCLPHFCGVCQDFSEIFRELILLRKKNSFNSTFQVKDPWSSIVLHFLYPFTVSFVNNRLKFLSTAWKRFWNVSLRKLERYRVTSQHLKGWDMLYNIHFM